MSTINVLTVVDCNTIVAKGIKGGTASSPTNLGSYGTSDLYIYMMAPNSYVVNDQAKSELTIKAAVTDTVIWSITCIGAGTAYNTILQAVTPQKGQTAITSPIAAPFTCNLYVGAPSTTPSKVTFTNNAFMATVLNISMPSVQYFVTFHLLDNLGNDLGYFSWDPFIQIQN